MEWFNFIPKAAVVLKTAAAMLVLLIAAGCAPSRSGITNKGNYFVDSTHPAISQNERIRFLVIHYTAGDDRASMDMLTRGPVSAHYLIPENPRRRNGKPVVLQLVAEDKRAWHAGISRWNGRDNLNDTSTGIEIVNPGYTDNLSGEKEWIPYNQEQLNALALLARDIIDRYHITPDNVLGHSDVAPQRKQDPGKLFPWKWLAAQGIGAWPDATTVSKYLAGRSPNAPADVLEIQTALSQYGYDSIPKTGIPDEETKKTIAAFQMHFRPDDISGNADAETEAIARALVEKYRYPEKLIAAPEGP